MISFTPRMLLLTLEGRKVLVTDIDAQASVATNQQSSAGLKNQGLGRTARYELKSPPFFDWGIIVFLIFSTTLIIFMMLPQVESAVELARHGLGAFLVYLFIAVVYRLVRQPFDRGPIVFKPDAVCIGKKPLIGSHCYPYSDINLVQYEQTRWHQKLYIVTRRKTFMFDLADFLDKVSVTRLLADFRAHVSESKEGSKQLTAMDENVNLLNRCDSRIPVLIGSLAGLLILAFIAETGLTGIFEENTLVIMGANVPALLWQGELHRLFTANLLHLSFGHLITNLLVLIILGVKVEKLLGAATTLMIFLGTGALGTLGSSMVSPHSLSVGSSVGILGLLGAFLMLNLKYYDRLAWRYRMTPAWWVIVIILAAFFSFFFNDVDYMGHVLGFFLGVFLTGLLIHSDPRLVFRPSPSLVIRRCCQTLCFLYAVSVLVVILKILLEYIRM